jgi:hypothetical protein
LEAIGALIPGGLPALIQDLQGGVTVEGISALVQSYQFQQYANQVSGKVSVLEDALPLPDNGSFD